MSKIVDKVFELSDDEELLIKVIQPIETAYIPEGVLYIKNGAFANMSTLKKVVLPKTLKEIWSEAFYCCNNLKKINLWAGSCPYLNYIGGKAFYGCTNLSNDVGNTIVLSKDTIVGIDAFAKCSYIIGDMDKIVSDDYLIRRFFILFAFSNIDGATNSDLIEKLIEKNARFSELIKYGLKNRYSLGVFWLTLWIQARLLNPDYLKEIEFDEILKAFELEEAAKKLVTNIRGNKSLLTELTAVVNNYIKSH